MTRHHRIARAMARNTASRRIGGALLGALLATTAANAQVVKDEYNDFEQMEYVPPVASDFNPVSVDFSQSSFGASVVQGFEGISQYDVASVARNFIPPDTMGAVGTTQYTTFANGGFAVYDKATGARQTFTSDIAFWAAAGQTGANGDSRVLFDKAASRWVALSFGGSVPTSRSPSPIRPTRSVAGNRPSSPASAAAPPIIRRWRWMVLRPISAPTTSMAPAASAAPR